MENDLSALERMAYSGRGITIGMTPLHEVFLGYTVTGRSEDSRARELRLENSGVASVQLKPGAPTSNQALLEYPAIVPLNNSILASNGLHTQLLYTALMENPKTNNEKAKIVVEMPGA